MADPIQYVYAVVDADARFNDLPMGVDEEPVRVEAEGGVAALVSALDPLIYAPAVVEERTADLQWLGPRARAHDHVVTWASDRGAVVPLPMFSLFRDARGVRDMLRSRQSELLRTLERIRGRFEFIVRVFRIDELLGPSLGALSTRVAELERAAAAAPPGQRYLLQRKIEAERREELGRVGTEIAQQVFDTLSEQAEAAVVEPVPRHAPEMTSGIAVLNAAYLLQPDQADSFRRTLTDLIAAHERHGFRFEFTGPWPPYHFVREET
jgi:hypothetical protein